MGVVPAADRQSPIGEVDVVKGESGDFNGADGMDGDQADDEPCRWAVEVVQDPGEAIAG